MTYREFLAVREKEQADFDRKQDAKYSRKSRSAVPANLAADDEETSLESAAEPLYDRSFHYPHFYGK